MDINITLLPQFESVFLLSGSFFEGGTFVTSEDTVVYITVLPLDPTVLPYTVKIVGASVERGWPLAVPCKVGENEYFIKMERRMDVYSPTHQNVPEDMVERFFYYVKGKHLGFAMEMLSGGLRSTLGEQDLWAFFEGFTHLVRTPNGYYAVDGSGNGHSCEFSLVEGSIDDISVE